MTDEIPDLLLDEWLFLPESFSCDPTSLQWAVFTYGYIRELTANSHRTHEIPVAQMKDRYNEWFMILAIAKMNRLSEECQTTPLKLFDFSAKRKVVARRKTSTKAASSRGIHESSR